MPWITIIVWVLTYLLSSQKEGVSKGKAALLATGAAVGTYVLADPANPDNLLGIGQTSGDAVTSSNAGDPTKSGAAGTLGTAGTLATTAMTTAGSVLTNPNTAGTILAGSAATSSGIFSSETLKKYAPWIIGGVAIFLLKK